MPGKRLTYGWEPCAALFAAPNWQELIEAHYDELNVSGCLLDPDYHRVLKMEEAGLFRAWAARSGETLVGYIGVFIQPHIHYKSSLHAVEDLFLLHPEHRQGMAGYRMFTGLIAALPELGVTRFICHSKLHWRSRHDKPMDGLFRRLGFAATDMLWLLKLET